MEPRRCGPSTATVGCRWGKRIAVAPDACIRRLGMTLLRALAQVDEVVSRHAVSKLSGGTAGFTLVSNVFGENDQHLQHLTACARELMAAVPARVSPPHPVTGPPSTKTPKAICNLQLQHQTSGSLRSPQSQR